MIAKEPGLVEDDSFRTFTVYGRKLFHHEGDVFVLQVTNHGPQSFSIFFIEALVGIKPKNPLAGGVLQAFVAGRGKIIDPGKVENASPKTCRHVLGAIRRAGVDDDYLVYQVSRRFQTCGQIALLVLDNHAERYTLRHDLPSHRITGRSAFR